MTSLPFSVRRPKLVLLAWGLILAVMGFALAVYPGMKLNPTVKNLIHKDDPDVPFDEKAKKVLGDDEVIVIAVENPKTVFDIPTIAYIDQVTTGIEKIEGVRKVYSLTRADTVRGEGGMIVANDLISELPTTQEDLDRIEKETFQIPAYVNMIIAPDKKVTAINIELTPGHSPKDDGRIVRAIDKVLEEAKANRPPTVKTYISGFALASYLGATMMMNDMVTFSGLATLFLIIIMYLVLRSWHGVIFTMIVSSVGSGVMYGLLIMCGFEITMPLSALLVWSTAIAMEYSVYVVFAYHLAAQNAKPGASRHEALADAIKDVRFTVVMSALCTSAAFASFLTNPTRDVAVGGGFLAVGTMACCAAALTVIPAWISMFPVPVPPKERITWRRLQSFVDSIARFQTQRPYAMIAMLAAVLGAGGLIVSQLTTDADVFQYFKHSQTIYKDDQFIRHRMAGDTLLPAVIEAKDVDTFKEPANLQKLDEIAKYAMTLPHVTTAVSHADQLKLMNKVLMGGGDADYKLPETKAAVEQYLLLYGEVDDFHAWMDPDYKMAAITIRMNTMSSKLLVQTEKKLEAFMKTKFPDFHARVLGTTLLTHRGANEMAIDTIIGLVTAAILICIIMIIGFRSVRIGLIALIPTAPPALMVYATLPIMGHALDPPTAIVGSVALGIAIDDTTWFIRTWIDYRGKPNATASTAVTDTMTAIGRPMVLSSMVLGTGFSVLLFSSYGVLFLQGIMMALVAFWSIFWDALLTPTLMRLIDPKLPRLRSSSNA